MMDRDRSIITEHLPLEEVMLADIDGIEAPLNWSRDAEDDSPEIPPVVIEENRGFSLVGNHRTVWHLKKSGKSMVKCLIVRSIVHVKPAHSLIRNCAEEAMLFEALLRRNIVPNRSRLADMLGYSRARITQLLNQLKLPKNIRQRVLITDDVSEFKLRPLLKFLDDDVRLQMGFKKLMEGKLSGRQMAVVANSDLFEVSTETPGTSETSESEKNKTPIEITLDDPVNSIAELEGVFAGDEPIAEISTKDVDPRGKSNRSEEEHTFSSQVVKTSRVDMAEVLRDIGNIR